MDFVTVGTLCSGCRLCLLVRPTCDMEAPTPADNKDDDDNNNKTRDSTGKPLTSNLFVDKPVCIRSLRDHPPPLHHFNSSSSPLNPPIRSLHEQPFFVLHSSSSPPASLFCPSYPKISDS
ncbi:unnamed protein product [Pleuronectes platessa]|uniref:Uncharacterized protein n=1 Tax=Pleuronectes platessa TaxID=8262 RepID=A0A9N7VRK3_PLEPL|nr:unnamed protein product [Pleuronectes platessa]